MASLIGPSESALITRYWGRGHTEPSLREFCRREFADIVNIAFLEDFGSGQMPELNTTHCPLNDCAEFSDDIKYCQSKCIKVMVSLAGEPRLNSTEDAQVVADYLWNNYLGGESDSRPLGDAVLDGVELHIHHGNVTYLDDLARDLAAYNILLAATPECPLPDAALDAVIRTGVINYTRVEFFDNPPCQYTPGNTTALFQSWDEWSSYPGVNKLFLGIPIDPFIAPEGGYISPNGLVYEVLPFVKRYHNYGGLMVFPYLHHEVNFNSRLRSYAAAI